MSLIFAGRAYWDQQNGFLFRMDFGDFGGRSNTGQRAE
jgi:hypothetical protein